MNIVILDYGVGNFGSLGNALMRLGATYTVSSSVDVLDSADCIFLPGVGSARPAMQTLNQHDVVNVLSRRVLQQRVPVLGICLGMQLMSQRSEEGDVASLGWIQGETLRLRADPARVARRPHLGWNQVCYTEQIPILRGVPSGQAFYFAHSYYVSLKNEANCVATTEHFHSFPSVIQQENITGLQFHPELSHASGLAILRNFLDNV